MKTRSLCDYRLIALLASVLWVLGMLGAPTIANAANVPVGPAETTELDPVLIVADRDRRIVLNLVDDRESVTTYDNTRRGAGKQQGKYPDAIFNDAEADIRYILFDNVRQIQNLSPSHLQTLIANLEGSSWIVGVKGSDCSFKRALSLLNPATCQPTNTSGPELAKLLYRNPHGQLNELVIAAPIKARGGEEDPQSLTFAFQLMRDWHDRSEAFVGDSDDPWSAIQNFEWSGTTTGVFNGNTQTAGTYKFSLTPYWLDGTTEINGQPTDWYRIDFQTISEITNYEYTGHSFGDTSGKCGWWTTKMHADATVLTTGGQWWDFMPSTTVGSTSTGFSIGGNITTTQQGVTGSYSKTYGTSDVTIQVHANSVNNSIDWEASLSGCGGYSNYPYYHGASSAAKSTYNLDPSFIIAVPEGSPMVIEAAAEDSAGENTSWNFVVEKDHVKCDTVCDEIHTHEYKSAVEEGVIVSCTETGCWLD